MANKVYSYKQHACTIRGKRVKAWHKPVSLIRKVADHTCEGCFFDTNRDKCVIMLKDSIKQLPPCGTLMAKRNYIFVKINKK